MSKINMLEVYGTIICMWEHFDKLIRTYLYKTMARKNDPDLITQTNNLNKTSINNFFKSYLIYCGIKLYKSIQNESNTNLLTYIKCHQISSIHLT